MAGLFDRLRSKFGKQNHRKNVPERLSKKVENKDYLLNQIDEFREKAQQLQELLVNKETKVSELTEMVEEKTEQAEELEQVLRERQDKADDITESFKGRIDEMIASINDKLSEVEKDMEDSLEAGRSANNEQTAKLADTVKVMTEELTSMKSSLEGIKSELVDTVVSLKEEMKATLEESNKETKDALEATKNELTEKIHNENVNCYRNIQGLVKEYEGQFEKISLIDQNVKSVRGFSKFTTWMTVINFLFLIAFILYSLGVFNFI